MNLQPFVNFHFPFINRIDIHKKPSWVNSAVFYQIFPGALFATETLSFLRRMWRLGAPRRTDRFLWAEICRVLPKSFPIWKNWGVNALYLTPIFEATSNHKYDTPWTIRASILILAMNPIWWS